MRISLGIFTLLLAVMLVPVRAGAQALDPSGHYEGVVSSPAGELALQVDLSRDAKGGMIGTLSVPIQKLKGFPLTAVVVNGNQVSFDVATSGGGYFRGELGGKVISGEFSTQMGAIPLDLERKGDAVLYAPPSSARISKELEGTWNGVLDVDGGMRVTVTLANLADGTSTGKMISVDENNLALPLAIVQDGTSLTLEVPMVGSSYVATINAAGTEMSGTYTTSRGQGLALLLKHATGN